MQVIATRSLLGALGFSLMVWGVAAQSNFSDLNKLGYYDDQVDLSIVSSNPLAIEAVAGTTVSIEAIVGNRGPAVATNTQLLIALSAGLSVIESNCLGPSDVVCQIGTLPVDTEQTFNFTLQVDPMTVGVLDVIFAVVATEPERNLGQEQLARAIVASRLVDLSIEFDSAPRATGPGTRLQYWLSAKNAGPSGEPGAFVSFVPDPSLQRVNWDCFSLGNAQCEDLFGAGEIIQRIMLPPGAEVLYRIQAQVPEDDLLPLISWALIDSSGSDDNPSNDSVLTTTQVESMIFANGFEAVMPRRLKRHIELQQGKN